MQITCPACAKKNEIPGDTAAACARCGCDLSILRRIFNAAQFHLSLAKLELEQRDWSAALTHAERSWKLTHTPESARVACIAATALRETPTLARWRRRAA